MPERRIGFIPRAVEINETCGVFVTDQRTISFVGLGLFGGFGILSGILLMKHSRDKKKETSPVSPYIDVVIFDEEPRK